MSLRRAASVSAARAWTLVSICWASSRALSVVMGSALRAFLVLAVVVNQQPLSHPAARAGVASASRGGSPISWSAAKVKRKSLRKGGFEQDITSELSDSIADFQRAEEQFKEFSLRAKEIWANNVPLQEFQQFSQVLAQRLPGRRLYDLQLLAAYHLAFAQNAANFSAPG